MPVCMIRLSVVTQYNMWLLIALWLAALVLYDVNVASVLSSKGVHSGQKATHLLNKFLMVLELIMWYTEIKFIFFIINSICSCGIFYFNAP